MKTQNSHAIIVMCSHLCKGMDIVPLEPSEWAVCAERLFQNNKTPNDLFNFSDGDFAHILDLDGEQTLRYKRLLDRSASIALEYTKLEAMGIFITTRADSDYPKHIKEKLKNTAPPLFYYCGNIEIANNECIGFVGSRSVDSSDIDFTKKLVQTCLQNNFSIVSGGAKGVDSTAAEEVIRHNGVAIEYLADSLGRKIKNRDVVSQIRNEHLLLLSSAIPSAGFNVGMAMQRNKYIYSQSLGTVVVKSDYNKGGTWAGAVENLKHRRSHTYCWDNGAYKGNMELIKRGAIPIDVSFDPNDAKTSPLKGPDEQMSLFGILDD